MCNLKLKEMKKLGKLKLNQLSKAEFELKEDGMKALKGGDFKKSRPEGLCVCVCLEPSFPTSNYPIATHTNEAI